MLYIYIFIFFKKKGFSKVPVPVILILWSSFALIIWVNYIFGRFGSHCGFGLGILPIWIILDEF